MRLASFVNWIFNGVGSQRFLRTLPGNFANLRGVPHTLYTHSSVSIDHSSTAHNTIGSIRSLFVEIRLK